MSFEKSVIVLKQTEEGYSSNGRAVSGIVRIERDDGVSTLFLSLVNFAPKANGEYFLFIVDGKEEIFKFSLGKRPYSVTETFNRAPDLTRGFAAGVCYLSSDLPTVTAFQRSQFFDYSLSDFKKRVADKCIEQKKLREKEESILQKSEEKGFLGEQKPMQATDNAESAVTALSEELIGEEEKEEDIKNADFAKIKEEAFSVYNDEAVATENFYALEESIKTRTELLGELQYEALRNEDICRDCGKQKTAQENASGFTFSENEKNLGGSKRYTKDNPYYAAVKEEIASLFEKFPIDESLDKIFPEADFIKINYSADKYYLVGVIKERGKEKYVCYGIPAVYSQTPPKELYGYCRFIPVSVFDLKGDGFWMMFQDAITGECLKPE